MQVSQTNSKRQVAQEARGVPRPGSIGEDKNGNRQAIDGSSASIGTGFHFLEKHLRSRSLFELAMTSGLDSYDVPGLLDLVDTEEKQLQCIADLYAIVKAQPKYKDTAEKQWSSDTSPITVILWLLKKLGPIANGERWTIDTFRQQGRARFCFVVYRYYNRTEVRNDYQFIPLEFLPYLKRKDPILHDLIVDVVALVCRENKIPLWDNDGDFSYAVTDYLKNTNYKTWETLDGVHYRIYSTGIARQYLRLIKQRMGIVTADKLYKRATPLQDKDSQRLRSVKDWIRDGIALSKIKQCITKNTYIPQYEKREVLTPVRNYKFVWSNYEFDPIYKRAKAKLEKSRNNADYGPARFSITGPGQLVAPIGDDDYPRRLDAFMRHGFNHLTGQYWDYYFKKLAAARKTPTTLLERLPLDNM